MNRELEFGQLDTEGDSELQLLLIGVDMHTMSLADRQHLALRAEKRRTFCALIRSSTVSELLVLSTCQRTEILLATTSQSAALVVERVCSNWAGVSGYSPLVLKRRIRYSCGSAAKHQLLRIATGLDSRVQGELGIYEQVLNALNRAKEEQSIGSFLELQVEAILKHAKRIRRQSGLAQQRHLFERHVLTYVQRYLPDVGTVLVLGSGRQAKRLTRYLHDAGKLRVLCSCGVHAAYEYSPSSIKEGTTPLARALDEASLIISTMVSDKAEEFAVAARGFAERSDNALRRRVVLDLSLPRSIAPSVATMLGAALLTIDDVLKEQVVISPEHLSSIFQAEMLFHETVRKSHSKHAEQHQRERNCAMWRALHELEQLERLRTERRLRQLGFSREDRAQLDLVLQSFARSLLGRVLHRFGPAEVS